MVVTSRSPLSWSSTHSSAHLKHSSSAYLSRKPSYHVRLVPFFKHEKLIFTTFINSFLHTHIIPGSLPSRYRSDLSSSSIRFTKKPRYFGKPNKMHNQVTATVAPFSRRASQTTELVDSDGNKCSKCGKNFTGGAGVNVCQCGWYRSSIELVGFVHKYGERRCHLIELIMKDIWACMSPVNNYAKAK